MHLSEISYLRTPHTPWLETKPDTSKFGSSQAFADVVGLDLLFVGRVILSRHRMRPPGAGLFAVQPFNITLVFYLESCPEVSPDLLSPVVGEKFRYYLGIIG